MFTAPAASGIYAIRNTVADKRYVGSAVNLKQRAAQHFNDLVGKRHYNRHLSNAWAKYSEGHFVFEVLEIVEAKSDLIEREQHFIDLFRSADQRFGYNSRKNAASNLGHTFGPEMREKLRVAFTGRKQSKETVERRIAPLRGRRLPEAHCLAISAGKLGGTRPDVAAWASAAFRRFSPEQIETIRADYQRGLPMSKLAKQHACSISTIHRALKGVGPAYEKGGIVPRPAGGVRKNVLMGSAQIV